MIAFIDAFWATLYQLISLLCITSKHPYQLIAKIMQSDVIFDCVDHLAMLWCIAPTEGLLGDMGWSTARTRHRLLILKFWNRLCNLHTSRLTRRVFDWDRLYTNKRGTWCYNIAWYWLSRFVSRFFCLRYNFCSKCSCWNGFGGLGFQPI